MVVPRLLPDGLDVHLDADLPADDHAARLERHVPCQALRLAVDLRRYFARHLADGEAGTMAAALGWVVASARAEAPETHDAID